MQRDLALLRAGFEELGHGIVVVTRDHRIRVATTQARRWLAEYFGAVPRRTNGLPDPLTRWMKSQENVPHRAPDIPTPRQPLIVECEGRRLVVRFLSEQDQSLLLLQEQAIALAAASLAPLGLSRREMEVLALVGEGKTNPVIGTILGLSKRTVQHWLERVFRKVGVETRTAAAARALETCGSSGPPFADRRSGAQIDVARK